MKDSHIKSFTANVLTELDHGALGVELNRQLQVLARDIIDRPMDAHGKPTPARKLKLAFELRPIIEFDQEAKSPVLKSIAIEPTVDGITPKVIGGVTELRMIRGQLLYNKFIPDKFDQRPLFDHEEEPAETEED